MSQYDLLGSVESLMRIAIRASDATTADRVAAAVSAVEGVTARGVTDVADDSTSSVADLLITVGERALGAAAEAGESRPILPLGLGVDSDTDGSSATPADRGANTDTPQSASAEQTMLSAAADTVGLLAARDRIPTVTHRPLSLSASDDTATAVCDCALLTTEPARISEYRITTNGRSLATFRADGVVVATPLGSGGYNHAAGGPRLAPETGVAVTPVAPFATRADDWVCSPPLSVTVERDDDVTVYADSRPFVSGSAGFSVTFAAGEPFFLVDWAALDAPQQLEKL